MIVATAAHVVAEQTIASIAGWRKARLRAALDGPLAVVATGGTYAAAVLWARLHEASGGPAWALTPADFVRRTLPADARVLILSASGRHHDILAAARAGQRVYAVVCDRSAPLCDIVRQTGGDALVLPRPTAAGLADPTLIVPFAAAAAAMYGSSRGIAACFEIPVPEAPATRPRHVLALGAGLGLPAAIDLTNRCREAGLATGRASDWRDVAHGDLLAVDPKTTWIVLLGMPADAAYLARFAALLPEQMTVLPFIARDAGIHGALQLLRQAGGLAWSAMQRFDAMPSVATLPDWVRSLYRLADA